MIPKHPELITIIPYRPTHTYIHNLIFHLTGLSVILIIFSSAEAAVNIFILKYI